MKHHRPAAERLLQQSMPEPMSGCWLWMGTITQYGYGQLSYHDERVLAHRLSYQTFAAEIPEGLAVLHKCDIRSCINPDHLYAGTNNDNVQDAVRRNRIPWGEGNHNAKLTAAQVKAARNSTDSKAALARKFDVSRATVARAIRGETWAKLQ